MKKEEKREVVIDAERKRQIFLECHFNELGHHLGQKKTVHRIQSKYYWLGIVKDVVDWVSELVSACVCVCLRECWPLVTDLSLQIKVCETCQHTERSKSMARMPRPLKVDGPWDFVTVEILGVSQITNHNSTINVLHKI